MNIFIFGFDNTSASSMIGLMDIFKRANQLLSEQHCMNQWEEINVRLTSVDGNPVSCQNGILLNVDCGIDDIKEADVFIITTIHDMDAVLPRHGFILDWLNERHAKGTVLASACTGVFLLAETGLLDGKDATTHWSMAGCFQHRTIINYCMYESADL